MCLGSLPIGPAEGGIKLEVGCGLSKSVLLAMEGSPGYGGWPGVEVDRDGGVVGAAAW